MQLRIAAGFLKGRVIRMPDKKCVVRPTLERTRISIADMVCHCIEDARCADLCAGSGAMGFELISRGALSVDFVEQDRTCARLLREHAHTFGVGERCRIIESPVERFVRSCREKYAIVFFDPPYDCGACKTLVGELLHLLFDDGILLYQRRRKSSKAGAAQPASRVPPFDVRRYGDTIVECFRQERRS
ncbi:MAG: RsmD family RNA methyltransferase [Chitinispirillaceae bacterium]|nr:RsmD family RNA methyltransferase [Chitinispirillaceae bacterium]